MDAQAQIVVAANVSQCAADNGELLPLIQGVIETTRRRPERVLADSGYKSEANFRWLEQRKIAGYVALGRGEVGAQAVPDRMPATSRMARKLKTVSGRRRYKRRKAIVEPAFGWVKNVLGFRSFSLRGLSKVRGEWDLVCLALNLRRMAERITWI